MSRTTPNTFYQAFVVLNYEDYCAEPDDIRRGFNASVSAFQLADIMHAYCKRHDPGSIEGWPKKAKFLEYLCIREPYFATIQSIATVYKHMYARSRHFDYEVDTCGALVSLTLPRSGMGFDNDWSNESKRDVIVRRRDKTRVSLSEALEAVVERMWPAVLPREETL